MNGKKTVFFCESRSAYALVCGIFYARKIPFNENVEKYGSSSVALTKLRSYNVFQGGTVSDLYNTKYIAENMYTLRKTRLHLSQEAFSEITNLSKDTISNIERGRYRPNLETLVSISNATGVSVDYFLKKPMEEG